ncbi:MAG: ATP-binding protein, partial [Kiritimatiellae bacterium]|nr:ATP-binding protein [Kiritimatiellia bacterium]
MENVIFSELVARGADVDVGVVDTEVVKDGVRHRRQLAIDVIVILGLGKIYIQSAYAMNSERKKSQETASLEKRGDSCRKLVMRGVAQPRYTDDEGITYIGVMDFLLDPSVLNALIA